MPEEATSRYSLVTLHHYFYSTTVMPASQQLDAMSAPQQGNPVLVHSQADPRPATTLSGEQVW